MMLAEIELHELNTLMHYMHLKYARQIILLLMDRANLLNVI